jgi:fructose-1,6-bisphosphatase/inositol monophosphatase family enzyme
MTSFLPPSAAKARSSTTGGCASPEGKSSLRPWSPAGCRITAAVIFAVQRHFAGLRRFGAATLDLAYIAAGRFDAYWERDLSPWDLAAGILLVREAGGFVTDLDGGDAILTKGHVGAGNDTMHRELLRLLNEAGREAAKVPEPS